MKIMKRMNTEENRKFWAAYPGGDPDEIKELPYLGDSWWKAETELSIEILNIKLPGDIWER